MRTTKHYSDQNLNRAHYEKCKRADHTALIITVISLLAFFLSTFIKNFPK